MRLRESLGHARARNLDIKVVFDRVGMAEQKVRLAQLLLPVLTTKARNAEAEADLSAVPVLKMMMHVRDLVNQIAGSGYTLEAIPAEVE